MAFDFHSAYELWLSEIKLPLIYSIKD